jgi:hypothetical protein
VQEKHEVHKLSKYKIEEEISGLVMKQDWMGCQAYNSVAKIVWDVNFTKERSLEPLENIC